MTSLLAKSMQIIVRLWDAFFYNFLIFLMLLNIHIDLITLKTHGQQFTLTTKKSSHIIFKACLHLADQFTTQSHTKQLPKCRFAISALYITSFLTHSLVTLGVFRWQKGQLLHNNINTNTGNPYNFSHPKGATSIVHFKQSYRKAYLWLQLHESVAVMMDT